MTEIKNIIRLVYHSSKAFYMGTEGERKCKNSDKRIKKKIKFQILNSCGNRANLCNIKLRCFSPKKFSHEKRV